MSQNPQNDRAANRQALVQTDNRLNVAIFRFAWALVKIFFGIFFGFLRDRPSQVDRWAGEENKLAPASMIFHSGVSLAVLCTFGPVGFIYLPLAVLVVARRFSAARRADYELGHITSDAAAVLGIRGQGESASSTSIRNAMILRIAVLVAMGATAILGILALFKLPVAGLILWAGGATWGLWMHIAFKAADRNVKATAADNVEGAKNLSLFREVFGGSASEWEGVQIGNHGGRLVAVNPPLSAALRFEGADAILSLLAPEWELGEDSTQYRLVLTPVSDETLNRRAEEARSGGLIAGRVDSGTTETLAPTATVKIAAADFYA